LRVLGLTFSSCDFVLHCKESDYFQKKKKQKRKKQNKTKTKSKKKKTTALKGEKKIKGNKKGIHKKCRLECIMNAFQSIDRQPLKQSIVV
jgi:hypothetical protein